jgi:hypothetical protein
MMSYSDLGIAGLLIATKCSITESIATEAEDGEIAH